jgi:hypothetical protein
VEESQFTNVTNSNLSYFSKHSADLGIQILKRCLEYRKGTVVWINDMLNADLTLSDI